MSADGGLKVGAFLQAARSVCRNRDPQGSSPCVDVASVSSLEEYIRLCTGWDQQTQSRILAASYLLCDLRQVSFFSVRFVIFCEMGTVRSG